MTVLAAVADADGIRVELTVERWTHICERHPELVDLRDDVLRAVVTPARTRAGRLANEQWFYVAATGPSR